jgi:glycosyltransferase involved in cell wall biosynthesis
VKPILFVTNHVPPDRTGAFKALHERELLQLAIFGGRSHHATAGVDNPGVPHLLVSQREVGALASDARAVVCGTAGRVALPAAYRGARRAKVPFVLWSALWAHPRTPAHVLAGAPLLRRIYKRADAVVTYGSHVSEFAANHGATNLHVAPQAVDNEFWSAAQKPAKHPLRFVFVGRAARYKGVPELLDAWHAAGLADDDAELILVGPHDVRAIPGVERVEHASPEHLRNIYASSDVLVMPAIETRSIREPWGLVANEAMTQGLPVIATDVVGAAAGGLIRDGHNGIVVASGDSAALGTALTRLADDAELRVRLGAQGRSDVAAYTFSAWADGFSDAFDSLGISARGAW